MATESSESEEEGKIRGVNDKLIVDDDLREMGGNAAWSVSSCKPVMASPLSVTTISKPIGNQMVYNHILINIQFQKKVKLQLVVLYVDFKLVESYTPSKISIRAGDRFHNLKKSYSTPTISVYINGVSHLFNTEMRTLVRRSLKNTDSERSLLLEPQEEFIG